MEGYLLRYVPYTNDSSFCPNQCPESFKVHVDWNDFGEGKKRREQKVKERRGEEAATLY